MAPSGGCMGEPRLVTPINWIWPDSQAETHWVLVASPLPFTIAGIRAAQSQSFLKVPAGCWDRALRLCAAIPISISASPSPINVSLYDGTRLLHRQADAGKVCVLCWPLIPQPIPSSFWPSFWSSSGSTTSPVRGSARCRRARWGCGLGLVLPCFRISPIPVDGTA